MDYRTPLAIAAAFAVGSLAHAAPIRIDSGALEGSASRGIESFKGVPYAAPPVGDLRWRAPRPASAWTGIRTATAYGVTCMQGGNAWPVGTPSEAQGEDCLTLNVWRPEGAAPDARLPVMVWIPGGGWTDGSGSAPLYDGARLARHGVIVVTLNYRLGALGFLAHEELARESARGSSGNYGLLDQIAALQWVQRNIAAFGGDASRVTIFGESAGAMSVNLLTVSPLARGLFQRVIGQSGAVFIPAEMVGADAFHQDGAQAQGARFAAAVGAKSIADLRKLPAADVVKAQGGFGFHFILDHEVLPEEPYAVYRAGRQAPADMLIGWNADEGRLFTAGMKITAATLESGIAEELGRFPDALRPYYHATDDLQAAAARAAFEGDLRMGYDTWTWTRLQAATGRGKLFSYRFEQAPPYPVGSPFAGWGATHGAEMRYVFDRLDLEPWAWSASDRRLATTMGDYWTNFAKTGDPNATGLPAWPQYVPATASTPAQVMHLGADSHAGPAAPSDSLATFDAMFQDVRSKRPVASLDR